MSLLWVFRPPYDVVEDGPSGPLKAGVVVTCLVPSVAHRLQLSEQLEICGFLAIVSASNRSSASLKRPHDDVFGTFFNLLCSFVDPLCCFVGHIRGLVDPVRSIVNPICSLVDLARSLIDRICCLIDPLCAVVNSPGILVNTLL